jgi:hypothetical protein
MSCIRLQMLKFMHEQSVIKMLAGWKLLLNLRRFLKVIFNFLKINVLFQ